MRPKSMILIVVALGCGLIASIGISQVIDRQEDPVANPEVEKVNVYVAITDLDQGMLLTPHSVKIEEWPKNLVPEGAVTKLVQIEGKKTKVRLFPGEPILLPKLADQNALTNPSIKIPPGMRVVSVKVTVDSSASGMLFPGDKVDVLVYLRRGAGIPMTTTRTIMKNVSVFAVNAVTEREVDDGDSSIRAKTVSLLVEPSQAETITLASELGRIKLALRRGDDETDVPTTGATLGNLDGSEATIPGFEQTAANPKGGILENILGSMVDSDAEDGSDDNAFSEDNAESEIWSMEVISGDGDSAVFHWDNRDSLPLERVGNRVPVREIIEPQEITSGWKPPEDLFGPQEGARAEIESSDNVTNTDGTSE